MCLNIPFVSGCCLCLEIADKFFAVRLLGTETDTSLAWNSCSVYVGN